MMMAKNQRYLIYANMVVGYSRSYAQKHGRLPTLERININKIMLIFTIIA
jgi:hypothetical protein